jgi:uncharacterized membrane protein
MNFTLIDYTAFGLWILISVLISYILVDKLKFFKGDKNVKKVLTWGLILGHPIISYLEICLSSTYRKLN